MACRSMSALFLGMYLTVSSGAGQVVTTSEPAARGAEPPANGDVMTPDLDQVTRQLMVATNQFRKQEGRGELKSQPQLVAAARDFAEYLARNEKLSHEADGSNPRERAKKHQYEPCIVAENIAYEYNSEGFSSANLARHFMDGWKKSPGHRKNLLDPYILEAGMAVAHAKDPTKFYAVQVFGRPQSEAVEFTIVNQTNAKIEYQLADQKFTLKPHLTATVEPCAPFELKFSWPPSSGKPESFHPEQGDQFVVTRKQAMFRVIRKPASNQ